MLPAFKSWTVYKIIEYFTLGLLSIAFEISITVQQFSFWPTLYTSRSRWDCVMRLMSEISKRSRPLCHFAAVFQLAYCKQTACFLWWTTANTRRQTTGVSCPTVLGTLCGQLTFRLAWCREHSAVTAAELLQPRDLACHFTVPYFRSCIFSAPCYSRELLSSTK